MAYVEGRLVYDADSHIHEPLGYAEEYADPAMRAQLAERLATYRKPQGQEEALVKQRDPEFRAKDADEILLRKNSLAVGAVIREDRSQALDLLGFAAQLVFTTTYLDPLHDFDVDAEWTSPTRWHRRTTAASSPSAASTRGCSRSATCRSPTSTARCR